LIIITVGPGLGRGALALLGHVAFGIVRVAPGAIARELVFGPGRIARVRPIARPVKRERARAVAGELVVGVVDVITDTILTRSAADCDLGCKARRAPKRFHDTFGPVTLRRA